MSNYTEQAEAFRRLADVIESGNLPSYENEPHGLSTYLGFRSAESVGAAAGVFKDAGAVISAPVDGATKAVYPSDGYWPALEVNLYDWSDSND